MRKSTLILLLVGCLLSGTLFGAFFVSFSHQEKTKSTSILLNNQANEKATIEKEESIPIVEEEEPKEEKKMEEENTIAKAKTKSVSSNSGNSVSSSKKSVSQTKESQVLEDSSIQDADTTIMAYFTKTKADLEDTNLREKAKENFIKIVDFLFYDGKIKGYTFNELTTKTKLKVLKIALTIDKKIDSYFPDYKEKISKQTNRIYTNVKETLILKYVEITASICEKDAEICTSAKNDFQDMKKSFSITWDFLKKLISKGSTSIKTWYEIYSGK